jgi:hypothetical protein
VRQFRQIGPEAVEAVAAYLKDRGIRSVHYFGNADDGLIRRLKSTGAELTITDYFNRWGAETLFHIGDELSECECEKLRRPEWLQGVTFCFEGLPRGDLLLVDIDCELRLASAEPARFDSVLLVGEARSARHKSAPHRFTHFDVMKFSGS